MNRYFSGALLDQVFKSCLSEFHNAALVDGEGQPLYIKYQNLTDIGTYPAATATSSQYIKLADGEIMILNDPYSGGSILSTMTLIMAVEIPFGPRKMDVTSLYLSTRVAFKPKTINSQSVEQEGIRIPPTPVYQNGEMNQQLLQIINEHPQCPRYFSNYVEGAVKQLNRASARLKNDIQLSGIKFSKKTLTQFHSVAEERARNVVSEMTIGESLVELSLDGASEKLCLKVEVMEDKVIFDFTKTTPSKTLHLTDSAVIGACAGALFSSLNSDVPMNAGVLRCLDVITPKGSMVDAKYPEPVFLGLTDGVALVASTVIQLLGEIDQRRKMAQSGFSQCSIEVDFNKDSHYFEYLESGVAATEDRHGLPGFDLWKRSHLIPSIEATEEHLPVRILSTGYRQNSGGSGNRRGGDGVTKIIEVLENGEMTWAISPPKSKPEGMMGGKAASPAEIFIQSPGQTKKKLELTGRLPVKANDHIIMNSAGGGGYGELDTSDTDDD